MAGQSGWWASESGGCSRAVRGSKSRTASELHLLFIFIFEKEIPTFPSDPLAIFRFDDNKIV